MSQILEKRKGIPSFKGYYTSKISNKAFYYMSLTELAAMMIFDNKKFNWEKNSKLRIPYVFNNKERKYIPDFIVNFIEIIEIKGSADTAELPFKIQAAKNYCKIHNMKYSIVSYEEIRTQINWVFVKEYHFLDQKYK